MDAAGSAAGGGVCQQQERGGWEQTRDFVEGAVDVHNTIPQAAAAGEFIEHGP